MGNLLPISCTSDSMRSVKEIVYTRLAIMEIGKPKIINVFAADDHMRHARGFEDHQVPPTVPWYASSRHAASIQPEFTIPSRSSDSDRKSSMSSIVLLVVPKPGPRSNTNKQRFANHSDANRGCAR